MCWQGDIRRRIGDGAGGAASCLPMRVAAAQRAAGLPGAIAWMLLLAVLMAACSRGDPETRLRDTIDELAQTIADRDPAAMQQLLAEDFIGNEGLDRDGARRMAAALMLRYRSVAATFGPLEVRMSEPHATVRFKLILSGGSSALLPESARIYDVETGWRLDGDDWKLRSVRWTPAL